MTVIPQQITTILANYPFTVGIVIISGTSIMYINNNDYIDKVSMEFAWQGMRILSQLQIWYKDMFSNCCGLWSYEKDTSKYIYIIRDGEAIKTDIVDDTITTKYNNNYDLVIFKYPDPADANRYLYKRYNKLPNELNEEQPIKNLFIIVNIKYGSKTYSVDNVESFVIPNTRIFDRSYTQWYMKNFEGLEIFDDDYNIEVLDSDMKEVTFDHTKYIEITNNGYKISDNSSPNTCAWRSILTEEDISNSNHSDPINRKITLADITSPPLIGKKMTDANTVITPLSLRSNNTDVSFDIVDESEAN